MGSAIGSGAEAIGSGLMDAGSWVGEQAKGFGDWITSPTNAGTPTQTTSAPKATLSQQEMLTKFLQAQEQRKAEEQRQRRMQAAYGLMQMGNNMMNGKRGY